MLSDSGRMLTPYAIGLSCPVLSVCPVCLSVCLSVTLVHCGQTVGWIKMKLDMQVGLGSGHIVFDGTQLPSPKGTQTPNIWPIAYLLWRNGSMHQDAT